MAHVRRVIPVIFPTCLDSRRQTKKQRKLEAMTVVEQRLALVALGLLWIAKMLLGG